MNFLPNELETHDDFGMNQGHMFSLYGAQLTARASGALWWAHRRILCVSDLHLGKSDRIARRSGTLMPPYETSDTLLRLESEIVELGPAVVICLGDSFDDLAAAKTLPSNEAIWLSRLQEGREWIWIEGNHDPGPVEFAGSHVAEYCDGPLAFRHIALDQAEAEVSGHYHPKTFVKLSKRTISRPCFLYDDKRVILPAFGTFTGGLRSDSRELSKVMQRQAFAVLTGQGSHVLPMEREQ